MNLTSLSPTPSLFLTLINRITHRATSTLKSSSCNSSCNLLLPLMGSEQHASCTFLKPTTSFRWLAVVLCASPKTLHICARRLEEGPSSGITTIGEDMRDAVNLREARVCAEDL